MEYIFLIAMFAFGMILAALIGMGGLYAGLRFYQKDKGMKKSNIITKIEDAGKKEDKNNE